MTNRKTLDARDLRMINQLSAYAEAGRRAGKASRERDVGRMEHEMRWMRAAVALEHDDNKAAAREAFSEAYKAAATPSVAYFR